MILHGRLWGSSERYQRQRETHGNKNNVPLAATFEIPAGVEFEWHRAKLSFKYLQNCPSLDNFEDGTAIVPGKLLKSRSSHRHPSERNNSCKLCVS